MSRLFEGRSRIVHLGCFFRESREFADIGYVEVLLSNDLFCLDPAAQRYLLILSILSRVVRYSIHQT